ncbi:MAG: AAA family ATPase [Dehalococcoidia bacterium]|nr:AAA family ATPase [Dehalococcoidia bacterium]
MARVTGLTIKGYRSIKDEITVRFPENTPIVMVGENNTGKSNIVRALDLILGEWWPGNREPDDHEFWNREPSSGPIEICTNIDGITDKFNNPINYFRWSYDQGAPPDEKCKFHAITDTSEFRISSDIRDKCVCILVGADRRLSYQLSYTNKWTLLSKLMRKFHDHLTQDEDRVNRLKQEFESVKEIFKEVSEFGNFQAELSSQFQDMFTGMSYGLQIDFSAYDPSNYFHSLRLLPEEEVGQTRTFEELGTGQEQLLALAFAHAYAKAFYGGIILVIEEPEAHLHPLAQQWLAKKVRQMANDGLQIALTTHSPAFVDLLNLEGIALVRKTDGATNVKQLSVHKLAEHCIQYGADSNRTSAKTIQPFYSGSATQEILNGLFAKKVILVEGQTESLALPVYLTRVGLDVTKEGIAVVPVMGKGNLAKWWRFFTAYSIPTFLTFDNDAEKDRDEKKRRDALATIGIADEAEVTSIIGGEGWYISDSCCVFGWDFEETMRNSFADYGRLEGEAKQAIGDSKPLVARHVAEKLELNKEDTGWARFEDLKQKLGNLRPTDFSECQEQELFDNDLPF